MTSGKTYTHKKRKRGNDKPSWLKNKIKPKYKDNIKQKITMMELKHTIEHMKNFRTAGEDMIPAEIYKTLTDQNLTILLEAYNSCLINNICPSE